MKVIGFDPSIAAFGAVMFKGNRERNVLKPVDSLVVVSKADSSMSKRDDTTDRVRYIFREVLNWATKDGEPIDIVCTEGTILSFNTSKVTASRLGRVRGVVDSLAELWSAELHEVSPKDLLFRLTGDPKAGKDRVQASVENLYPSITNIYPPRKAAVEHVADAAGATIVTMRSLGFVMEESFG